MSRILVSFPPEDNKMGRKKDCKIPQFDNHTIRPVSFMFSPSTFLAP
jgi:hypothetical protein